MKSNFKNILPAAMVLMAVGLVGTGCTKADYGDDFTKGDAPPVAGGFTNSDQVAATNLLAFWNFETNNNETKSNTAPITEINAASILGIKGKGLRLNSGFVLYPTITALSGASAISSCTVSLWVNVANNGSQASQFFSLSQSTAVQSDWLGILNIAAETGRSASEQNIAFHSWIGSYPGGARRGGDNINDFGVVGVDFKTVEAANKWVQYIMTWDAVAENLDLYVNNVRVSNNNFRNRAGFGPIVSPIPTQVLLGGFPTAATGFTLSGTQSWQALLSGSLDEIRVYNKALTEGEISALYQLERQGR